MSVGSAEDAAADESEWAARAYDGDANAALLPLEDVADGASDVDAEFEAAPGSTDGSEDQSRVEPELAVLGDTCPICLQTLAEPVMVRDCYHVYCFECLRTWVSSVALHGVHPPPCPLCKAPFDTVYANVRSETDFELFHFCGRGTRGASTRDRGLSPDAQARERTQRRSLVYRRHMRLAKVGNVAVNDSGVLPKMVKIKGEYERWLERELQACIGREVDLTVLLALIQCCLDKLPGFGPAKCYAELEAALAPFLYEDAAVFVRELAHFLGSRLTVDAYDDAVEYRCSNSAECPTSLCNGMHS